MIDIIKQTPIEYSKQSRDYQVIARLYTALFNLNKMYIDNMHVWNKDIDNKLTTLRAKTLNFNPNHSWDLDALEAAVSCFKYIMFIKGTYYAIEYCINILLRINKLDSRIRGIVIKDGQDVEIKIPVQLASIGIVQDLLDYILPAGMTYRVKEYQAYDEGLPYTVGSTSTIEVVNDNIPSNTLGIASGDDSSEGPTNQGYTLGRNFVSSLQFVPHPMQCLAFTASTANSTISMSVTGTLTLNQNFQTSTDGNTWTEFIPGTTTITLTNVGDKVYFKGNNPTGISESSSDYCSFVMTGSIAASGNVMSLIDNGVCNTTIIPNPYCFCLLFGATGISKNRALTSAPSLPATTLTFGCYYQMFNNCEALLTPPVLPAVTLADSCYNQMFYNCKVLTYAPELQATIMSDSCYSSMFSGCSSLTIAPSLPATTLAYGCYQSMFKGCTSLTTIPKLPATILSNCCYGNNTVTLLGMFANCTSLYVSDTLIAGTAEHAWVIPENGVGVGDYTYKRMFDNCLGTRADTDINLNGIQKTYYTQNEPI